MVEDVIIPTDIPQESIHLISPMIAGHGVLYKNVSVLEDYNGNRHRVVGNYKDWINKIRPVSKIGYK